MKLFKRLHVVAIIVVCGILYFGWIVPSLDVKKRLQKVWSRDAVRVVVFGDNWSDTGSYRIAPPSPELMPRRDPMQGKQWTEVLCDEMLCDFVDNFARSSPLDANNSMTGSVISNQVLANITAPESGKQDPLADLTTQIRQWVNFEKQKKLMPTRHFRKEQTVFTVFFGLWDLWHYTDLDMNSAQKAIDETITELFVQLDYLAEQAKTPIRVVLPSAIDITLLPGFQEKVEKSGDRYFPQEQHRAIFLMHYWNTILSQIATKWDGGSLYMPDLNAWLVERIREHQLWSAGISDASGAGEQRPLFDEVSKPCTSATNSTSGEPLSEEKGCQEASKYLFWDSLHLGIQAHEHFGKETAALLWGNKTANIWRDQKNGESKLKVDRNQFGLVLPPGS